MLVIFSMRRLMEKSGFFGDLYNNGQQLKKLEIGLCALVVKVNVFGSN
jgi:hypothetical protein